MLDATHDELNAILREDFMSFFNKGFNELHPQPLRPSWPIQGVKMRLRRRVSNSRIAKCIAVRIRAMLLRRKFRSPVQAKYVQQAVTKLGLLTLCRLS